jgi:hypothetical protein
MLVSIAIQSIRVEIYGFDTGGCSRFIVRLGDLSGLGLCLH